MSHRWHWWWGRLETRRYPAGYISVDVYIYIKKKVRRVKCIAHLSTLAETSMRSAAPSPTAPMLWHKLRTSDEDGALKAIGILKQQMQDRSSDKSIGSTWVHECSSDGSALLHTVGYPGSVHSPRHPIKLC